MKRALSPCFESLSESKNSAAYMPEKVEALNALIDAFIRDTGALSPRPNPAFKPQSAESARIGSKI